MSAQILDELIERLNKGDIAAAEARFWRTNRTCGWRCGAA